MVDCPKGPPKHHTGRACTPFATLPQCGLATTGEQRMEYAFSKVRNTGFSEVS
jgi:hypothetical protein